MGYKYFVLLFFCTGYSFCQTHVALCPGLKFGISLGSKVEFVFGYEVSVVFYDPSNSEYNYYAFVINYDNYMNHKRLHLGAQYQYRFVGLELGPTFVWKDSKTYYGGSIVPYGGMFLLPYFNYTYLSNYKDQYEIGSYMKIAIPFQKEMGNFGG